jgi:hypothetical protein
VGQCLGINENESDNESPVNDFIIGADQFNKMKEVKLQDYIYEKVIPILAN